MDTFKQTKKLFYKKLRVSKNDASYLYFMMEARDGLCFYSTLEESLTQGYRDITATGTIEFKEAFENFLTYIGKEIEVLVLEDSIIQDS